MSSSWWSKQITFRTLVFLLSSIFEAHGKAAGAGAAGAAGAKGGGAGSLVERSFLGGKGWSVFSLIHSVPTPSTDFNKFKENAIEMKVDNRLTLFYAALAPYDGDLTNVCETKLNKTQLLNGLINDPNNISRCFANTFTAYFLCDHFCCELDCCQLNIGFLLFLITCISLFGACVCLCLHCFITSRSQEVLAEKLKSSLTPSKRPLASPIYTKVPGAEPKERLSPPPLKARQDDIKENVKEEEETDNSNNDDNVENNAVISSSPTES